MPPQWPRVRIRGMPPRAGSRSKSRAGTSASPTSTKCIYPKVGFTKGKVIDLLHAGLAGPAAPTARPARSPSRDIRRGSRGTLLRESTSPASPEWVQTVRLRASGAVDDRVRPLQQPADASVGPSSGTSSGTHRVLATTSSGRRWSSSTSTPARGRDTRCCAGMARLLTRRFDHIGLETPGQDVRKKGDTALSAAQNTPVTNGPDQAIRHRRARPDPRAASTDICGHRAIESRCGRAEVLSTGDRTTSTRRT